ncbi:MAG: GNAT family N-acetyltransferase [Thauera sp.]|nr:GNAT family N-acetyltransferase [Thauera sp.]
MSFSAPQPLAAHHRLEEFDCGKPALTDWLLHHARQAQGSGSARTFVILDAERVAAYFSLTVGQIDTLEAPERIRRGMGQYPIPLLILTRLAVDLDDQGQGLGFSMLQDAIRRSLAIAEQAGVRALLTHPIDASADAFYRRFGFESTPGNERQLILLLKDARRVVGRA